MRTKVNTNEVAHLWYYQSQPEARSAANYFFRGKTIYSYGEHFPIASLRENKKGEKVVLFTLRNYSNTTTKHICLVRRAIPSNAKIVYAWGMPSNDNWHIEPAKSFTTWERLIKNAQIERQFAKSKDYQPEIDRNLSQATELAKFLGTE